MKIVESASAPPHGNVLWKRVRDERVVLLKPAGLSLFPSLKSCLKADRFLFEQRQSLPGLGHIANLDLHRLKRSGIFFLLKGERLRLNCR